MGAPAAFPLGFLPVSRNFISPSIPHRCHRALVDVMSGVVACHLGTSASGLKPSAAPLSQWALSGSPAAVFAVWQSWHLATSSTRYFPRVTTASCAQRAPPPKAKLIAASPIMLTLFPTCPLPCVFRRVCTANFPFWPNTTGKVESGLLFLRARTAACPRCTERTGQARHPGTRHSAAPSKRPCPVCKDLRAAEERACSCIRL